MSQWTAARPVVTPDRPLQTSSLRRRVAVAVLLFLIAVLASLGLLVNLLLAGALKADLKTRLEDRASYAGLLQEQGVTGQTLADKLAGAGVFSTFTSGDHRYVGRDSYVAGPRPRPFGPPPRPAVAPTVSYSESDGLLTATVGLTDGRLTLQTSEVDIHRTLAELTRIELLAGAGAVLVAGLVLIRLIGVALRPLDRMTTLSRRIRDGARGRRLQPTRPRTDLGRTAVAFDEMLDAMETAEAQARSAELRMRQFLADASHDLRTPLAGVIAGSEQLLRSPCTRAEREARLVAVVRQARRAARLVDDLLLMTRLDEVPGPATGRPVDLAAVVYREIDALRMRRPDLDVRCHGVDGQIEVGPDARPDRPTVWADADQLHRAVGNLLENADRATPLGGRVTVGVRISPQDAVVTISDTGPGVPPGDRERIFDRFVRLTDSRSADGSGLGLTICRAILRAHGGDVRCLPGPRSIPAVPAGREPATALTGACFEVWLPRRVLL